MYEYVYSSACLLSRPNRRHRLRNSQKDNEVQLFLLVIEILLAREPARRRGDRQYEREPHAPLVRPHVQVRLKPARRRGDRQYEREPHEFGSSRYAVATTDNTSASLKLRLSVVMYG